MDTVPVCRSQELRSQIVAGCRHCTRGATDVAGARDPSDRLHLAAGTAWPPGLQALGLQCLAAMAQVRAQHMMNTLMCGPDPAAVPMQPTSGR